MITHQTPDPYQILTAANPQTIDELAAQIPSLSDDFLLPPLIPTVEDALILPRQDHDAAPETSPPDALHFLISTSSN